MGEAEHQKPASSGPEESAPLAASARADGELGVTAASAVFSVAGVCLIAWFLPDIYFSLRVSGPAPQNFGVRYLPMLPVFLVLLLVALGAALAPAGRRLGLRLGFGRRSLMVIFAATLMGIAGFDAIAFLIGLLPCPYYYATPENDLERCVLDYHNRCEHLFPLRPQYRPGDADHIELLYRGLPKEETAGPAVPWYNKSLPVPETIGPSGELPSAVKLDGSLAGAGWLRRVLPHSEPGRRAIWQVWARPMAWWIGLFAVAYFTQMCMMTLLRRQWFESEKLMFPHIEPILAAAGCGSGAWGSSAGGLPGIFRSGAFWAGAAVPAFILFFDGLSRYLPAVPAFNFESLTLSGFLVESPWNAMRPDLSLRPYMVAIAFLLTSEISFSLWFFAVLDNLCRVAGAAGGLPPEMEQAWNSYTECAGADSIGAIAVFILAVLWAGRRQFAAMLKGFVRPSSTADSGEPMPHRFAVAGFIAGTVAMLAWCRLAGMSWWVSALLFGTWYLILVYTARMIAEAGLLTTSTAYFTPPNTVVWTMGFNEAGMASTFSVNLFIWPTLHGGYGSAMLGWLMNGFKAAEGARRQRLLSAVVFLGIALSLVIATYRTLEYVYDVGGLNSEAGSFREVQWIFNNTYVRDVFLKDKAHSPDWGASIPFMILGAGVMAMLLAMRHLFYWWPLHPIGYVAIGIGGGVWFSFFLGWLMKRSVLKYGGGELLKRATPAAYGVFLGQFFAAGLWFVADIVLKLTGVVAVA